MEEIKVKREFLEALLDDEIELWNIANNSCHTKLMENYQRTIDQINSLLKRYTEKIKPNKSKVFLGGTCNESTWREEIIKKLETNFFNPVVDDWTPDCQKEEYRQKNEECNIHLYVITKEMTGVFSIAEVIDSVHTKGITTVFHVVPEGFSDGQLRSLTAVGDLIIMRGGYAHIDNDLQKTINKLND